MVLLGVTVVGTVMVIDGINEYGCDPTEYCAPWLLPVGAGLRVVSWVYAMIDAGPGAHRYNRRHSLAGGGIAPTLAVRRLPSGSLGVSLLEGAF